MAPFLWRLGPACEAPVVLALAFSIRRASRKAVGESPNQWLVRQCIERAKVRFRNADASLVDVAVSAGFCDESHCTRRFTAWVGISPGQWWRNMHR
ncbi:helix-turn-helix domain-containing protein [Mycolicibacterium moriokaense]|nr:helix-turn-helix domain-containing protein [Mycolicibacterium moriokaense]